jgi:hypothetical protein
MRRSPPQPSASTGETKELDRHVLEPRSGHRDLGIPIRARGPLRETQEEKLLLSTLAPLHVLLRPGGEDLGEARSPATLAQLL